MPGGEIAGRQNPLGLGMIRGEGLADEIAQLVADIALSWNVRSLSAPPVFAVSTIERWWDQLGKGIYPNAKRLLISADCGGSNG